VQVNTFRISSYRPFTSFTKHLAHQSIVPMSPLITGPLKRKANNLASTSPAEAKKPKTNASITSFFGQPKPTSNSSKPASVATNGFFATAPATLKFDKAKWVAKLTPEQRTLVKLEIDTLDESWLAHLKDEILSPGFLDLKRFLKSEIDSGKKVFPPMEEVYSWSVFNPLIICLQGLQVSLFHRSRHTPLSSVRAVILGQDPYHNHNQAHGLCFSVRPPTPAPPSLKNIYIAIANDYPSFAPPPRKSGLLTPWAEQGVLMLNTCLTVRAHEAASHKNKGWERFTQKVLDTVAKTRTRGVVFLAWGSPAQQRCRGMANIGKHLVLQSVHPSPLSAHKGFMTCGHFKKTNEWLQERYGSDGVINWDLNEPKPISAPKMEDAVKVTADQRKSPGESGPTTELVEEMQQEDFTTKSSLAEEKNEESADEDDADAIEALQEMARAEEDDADAVEALRDIAQSEKGAGEEEQREGGREGEGGETGKED
jgi:uracil-DNA glycosylase